MRKREKWKGIKKGCYKVEQKKKGWSEGGQGYGDENHGQVRIIIFLEGSSVRKR